MQLKTFTKLLILNLIVSLWILLCAGCSGSRPFQLKNLAKSDIDMVADIHQDEAFSLLRTLMIKLYKRNPRELHKYPAQTINSRLHQVFDPPGNFSLSELNDKQGTKAVDLCFDPEFKGDRVLALITGMAGMIRASYENRAEQFMLVSLDEQKLYNSARNVEIVVWRLSNRKNADGEFFLLTNSQEDEAANLSYERLFGKIISLQDMMARIIADRGNRTINLVVHSMASATFLPVGM